MSLSEIKLCPGCRVALPSSSFYVRGNGTLSLKCKPCLATSGNERNRLLREQKRPEISAVEAAHVDRLQREREAKRIAAEYRKANADGGHANGAPVISGQRCQSCLNVLSKRDFPPDGKGGRRKSCRPCFSAEGKRKYQLKKQRARELQAIDASDPEQQREILRKVDYLAARLAGTLPDERINTQEEWDAVSSELVTLWHRSGTKTCVRCQREVSTREMYPPISYDPYPSKCRPCTDEERDEHHRRTCGPMIGPLYKGAKKIKMRDGSWITVAELGRRVAAREAELRVKRKTS